jgi:porin
MIFQVGPPATLCLLLAQLCLVTMPLCAWADSGNTYVEGGLTGVYQAEVRGARQDSEASADLFFHALTAHGEWLLYLETATGTSEDSPFNVYPEINADAGTAVDSHGASRVQVSELNFRWDTGEGRHLTLGEIDPSAHLDRSRIANDENAHFLGASFVNNPTIAFPDYALGAMYRIDRTLATPEITTIMSGSDGLADNPGRSYHELIDITGQGKGLFLGLGSRWAIDNTRVGIGAWYRTDDHPVLGDPASTEHNYGAYALYGWQAGNHGVSLRAGAANSKVSPAAYFLGAAYEGTTPVGAIGLGVGKIYLSSRLAGPATDDTLQAEAFLRVHLLSEQSHITFVLQYIENPGFDASDATIDSRALIAGIRLHFWFGS